MKAQLKAIEYYLPYGISTNDDLSKEFPDYDFAGFQAKIGIRQRHIADKDETALDLAQKACEKMFTRFDRNDVDFILYCTQSPEYILPTTACLLQYRLNLRDSVGALDFNLGCSGYTYGLSLAKSLIASGLARNVLLVTAETYSKYINPLDRANRTIFGDAATASWISSSENEYMGKFIFGTDGSGFENLIVKNGAGRNRYDPNEFLNTYGTDNFYTDNNLYMNGPEVFNFTINRIPEHTRKVLEANSLELGKVSQFIFHQANAFMLDFLRKKLKIDRENFYIDLEYYGNTVSNTIPIALKDYSQSCKFVEPQQLVLVGFGVGLSWCGGAIQIVNQL